MYDSGGLVTPLLHKPRKTNSPLGNPHAARLSQMAARRADHEVMYCSVWALPNTTVQNTNQYMILEGLAHDVEDLPVGLGPLVNASFSGLWNTARLTS